MIVCKFGGTSLANADQIRKSCDIMLSDSRRKIMVVSAPGKRNREDIKVTDLLIALADALIAGQDGKAELENILRRFAGIAREMHLQLDFQKQVSEDLEQRIQKYIDRPEALKDALKAAGEDNCARLVAAYLNAMGHEATYINPYDAGMFLSAEFGNGKLLDESYENLSKLKDLPGILVFPGFFGYSKKGEIITFPRGGSDITGSILAASVQAKLYENWSDVDSVFAVNPALVANPSPIKEMTYAEMRELAYAGFSVLHEETLEPVLIRGIPLNIRNTNNPNSPGTKIVAERHDYDGIVTGISGSKGFCFLTISKYLMNKEVGIVYRILSILNELKIPFEHMPSGIDSITIVMRSTAFTPELEKLVRAKLEDDLKITNINVQRGLALVMVVGAAMAQTTGVMARATTALGRAGINLELVNQGAAELSIIFGIREEYCHYAIKELYNEFFRGREAINSH